MLLKNIVLETEIMDMKDIGNHEVEDCLWEWATAVCNSSLFLKALLWVPKDFLRSLYANFCEFAFDCFKISITFLSYGAWPVISWTTFLITDTLFLGLFSLVCEGCSIFVRKVMEILKQSKANSQKMAYKLLKKSLGTHRRALRKREELQTAVAHHEK